MNTLRTVLPRSRSLDFVETLMPTSCADSTGSKQAAVLVITHRVSTTALYLYAFHFLNYLVPALTVAFLTRRLSPAGYGNLIIAQSLGFTVSTLTEYGFRWTGARAVAESTLGADLGPLVSSISAAKVLIATLCSLLIPIYMVCIRSVAGHLWLIAGGYVWGVLQGSDLQWYFLGRERLRGYLAVDSAMRVLAVALILVCVHNDSDAPRVLIIQSICTLGLLAWAFHRVASEATLVRPSKKGIKDVMRDGGSLFLQQFARYASSGINIVVLGMVAAPAEVGFFACADKLVRYIASLSVPITQIAYPKISRTIGHAGHHAAQPLINVAGATSLLLAVVASSVIVAMPRSIILMLYGAKMLPAVSALRVVAIFPVLNSLTTSLVYYWLIPRRMESISLRVIAFAGIVNVISIAALGKLWNQSGAATAVMLAEAITLIGYFLALRLTTARRHRDASLQFSPERI